uniref:Olfactory receptor family 1 subfamily F member 1 n=1 Tax=Balaenoptera musculus TaxID=9771 RepID=A0A8C0I182_BALMU
MGETNQSSNSEFLLLGLSRQPQRQKLLFVLFLSRYLATVLGNLLILLAISPDSHLHIPMSFFLCSLSFVDVCFSSTTVPKMMANHIFRSQTISFSGCLMQMYFVFMFVDMDNFFLAVMAYDSFVAVCHPLHYSANMTHQPCALLVTGSLPTWICYNAIPPFSCDVTPLLKLFCSDTHLNEVMILTEGALIMSTPFVCIVVSYIHITCAVLRVPSTKGRWKAFSTCGSHLAVVSFFYGTIIAVYFNPLSSHSNQDKFISLFYSVVTPMVNPLIYTLRNKEVKRALRRLLGKSAEGRENSIIYHLFISTSFFSFSLAR